MLASPKAPPLGQGRVSGPRPGRAAHQARRPSRHPAENATPQAMQSLRSRRDHLTGTLPTPHPHATPSDVEPASDTPMRVSNPTQ